MRALRCAALAADPAMPRLATLLVALALLAGCGPPPPGSAPASMDVQEFLSEKGLVRVTPIARGLEYPWSLAFLPDGRMLVSERPGRLRLVDAEGTLSAPLEGVPPVFAVDQGGLLDVVLDPAFAANRRIYFSYSEVDPEQDDRAGTAIARATLADDRIDDVTVIFRQADKLSWGIHFGSRLVFDREGRLYATLGENKHRMTAQELGKHQGKIIRILTDGSVPPDNPFAGRTDTRPELWSYGHRNPQGAALHPVTGELWTHEHGPRGGDELNIARAGRNYGWPLATHGSDYPGNAIAEAVGQSAPGTEPPLYVWEVSPALSGMAFLTAPRLAAWQGDLFVGGLAAKQLIRLDLDGERVVGEERLGDVLEERIRDVREGPDGLLYLLTDAEDGRILRVELLPPEG
jgi:glucose/arabinose dehydrogenase